MGYSNYSSGVIVKVFFKPCYSFCIKMVCRFVEKENIRLLKKKTAESNTAPLTSGKHIYNLVCWRTSKSVHSKLKIVIEIPGIEGIQLFLNLTLAGTELIKICIRVAKGFVDFIKFSKKVCNWLYTFLYNFHNSFAGLELRLLFKVTDCVTRSQRSFTSEVCVFSGKNLKKRRFTGTVRSYNADFRTIIIGNTDIFKNHLSSIRTCNAVHCVYNLLIIKGFCHLFLLLLVLITGASIACFEPFFR